MNPIAAPKTLRYEPDAGLPVAIEAKSNRRYFYPSNGDKFGPKATNVIRMTLNANSFLDFSHSYLQFTVQNTNPDANEDGHIALDQGVPFFNRLQIMSGGQELEDIQEYSRLYSILQSVQGSRVTADESSLTQHKPFAGTFAPPNSGLALVADDAGGANNVFAADLTVKAAGAGVPALNTAINNAVDAAVTTAINNNTGEGASYKHTQTASGVGRLTQADGGSGGKLTYNVPIISAFFNIDKYFPLLLTEQGLDLYFYLEQPLNIGVHAARSATANYEITDVRYVAHEVNLDDAFVNQMKASMQATGGVLSLSSTTYRYNNITGAQDLRAGGQENLNISCRVKSLKGMLVRPQASCLNNSASRFCISTGQSVGITDAQFRIGSVLYPQSAIKFSNTNKGELFNEVRKCFGTIGSYAHGSSMNSATIRAMDAIDCRNNRVGVGTLQQNWLLAYDFETFAKSATESGINVSDRMLPVSLELTRAALENTADPTGRLGVERATGGQLDPVQTIRYDCFAMCDCIIYIDLMGKITTRI
eukprot:COSAG06_NODE_178_length_20949_cov_26.114053_5_plen_534_part_00